MQSKLAAIEEFQNFKMMMKEERDQKHEPKGQPIVKRASKRIAQEMDSYSLIQKPQKQQ